MYDPDNVFSKILRGELPVARVYEDDHTLAFMDAMPQSDGHTLVIPKAAARNFFDLPAPQLAQLIVSTQHVARAVQQVFQPQGMRIMQFNEAAAGQTVFHIHFHIIPCYEGQPLREHNRDWADKDALAQHAQRLRTVLEQLPAPT